MSVDDTPDLMVLPHLARVFVDHKEVCLTMNEYRVLLMLWGTRGHLFSYEAISLWVWNAPDAKANVLVEVNNLRRKLDNRDSNRFICNVRSAGYYMRESGKSGITN